MDQQIDLITEADLPHICGTTENLESNCTGAVDCWKGIENSKTHENQIPYLPYVGSDYKGILFAGTNLYGVMGISTAIAHCWNWSIHCRLKLPGATNLHHIPGPCTILYSFCEVTKTLEQSVESEGVQGR